MRLLTRLPGAARMVDGDSRLRPALDELEREIRIRGGAVTGNLAPGIGPARVQESLAQLGLTATPELIDWFGWHNGVLDDRVTRLLVCFEIRSLAETVAEYERANDGFDPWHWHPDWLPLMALDSVTLALYCGDPDRRTIGVRAVQPHTGMFHSDAPGVDSLATAVAWWIDDLRTGFRYIDSLGRTFVNEAAPIPEERKATGLV